jgi:uncharacterized membrane protein (UPF0136 family)
MTKLVGSFMTWFTYSSFPSLVSHAVSVSSVVIKSKSYYCRDSSGMTKLVGSFMTWFTYSSFPSLVCHAGSVSSLVLKQNHIIVGIPPE